MGSGLSEAELSYITKLSAGTCYLVWAIAGQVPPAELTAASLPSALFPVCLPNPAAPRGAPLLLTGVGCWWPCCWRCSSPLLHLGCCETYSILILLGAASWNEPSALGRVCSKRSSLLPVLSLSVLLGDLCQSGSSCPDYPAWWDRGLRACWNFPAEL